MIRRHPQYAFDLLSPVEYLRPALTIPYCHHERFDGSGYPRGLKKGEIPLRRVSCRSGRFDALTSDRPYRKRWSRKRRWLIFKNKAAGISIRRWWSFSWRK